MCVCARARACACVRACVCMCVERKKNGSRFECTCILNVSALNSLRRGAGKYSLLYYYYCCFLCWLADKAGHPNRRHERLMQLPVLHVRGISNRFKVSEIVYCTSG